MRRSRLPGIALLLGTLLGAQACADDGGRPAPPPTAEDTRARDTATRVGSPTRVALPGLFSIMAGLQSEMARISRGLWLEAMDTVAAGADGVANHPRVPPEEFRRIQGVLGEEMSRFGGLDGRVHDLAVRLAEEARAGDLDAVLSTDAELRRACVACHAEFRERLRDAIR